QPNCPPAPKTRIGPDEPLMTPLLLRCPGGRSSSLLGSTKLKIARQVSEAAELLVLLGDHGPLGCHRPCDGAIWIVPEHAAVEIRRIVGTDLVDDDRVGLERAESVREPRRDVKLVQGIA